MKCPACNSEMDCTQTIHHYTESGLDNIFLEGVTVYNCSCGENIVSIPAMPELHRKIGFYLIKKKSLLNGREIRFLRKNIGLTTKKLSDYTGVDNTTILQWENDQLPVSKSHDRLLRLIYSNIKGIPSEKIKNVIEKDFTEIVSEQKEILRYAISVEEWF